jgi:hypothetical protein
MSALLNRRQLFRGALAAGAAGFLWPRCSQAASTAFPFGPIVIDNDYAVPVLIHLYHADALDRRFATYTVRPGRVTLALHGASFNIGADWGVQIQFGNRALSRMQRVCNVASFQDGRWVVTASLIVSTNVAYSSDHHIRTIDGYEIDSRFSNAKQRFLTDALALFYERFLQLHWRVMPELGTKAGVKLADNFPTDSFDGVEDKREYMQRQFIRMSPQETFPHVKLVYAYEEGGDWLARAYLGTVRVWSALDSDFAAKGRYSGSFEIEMNDSYVGNGQAGRHYARPEYWAGVIAHEALHNLGHAHLPSRSDAGYYLYQMILIEHLVMTNGRARYGDTNPTPVLCMRRPE